MWLGITPNQNKGATMKKLTKKQITELLVEAENIHASLDAVKPLYKRLDEIVEQLISHDLSGTGYAMVDNFAEKNTVFRMAGVKRFELKKVAS